jgi:hypothetical protein
MVRLQTQEAEEKEAPRSSNREAAQNAATHQQPAAQQPQQLQPPPSVAAQQAGIDHMSADNAVSVPKAGQSAGAKGDEGLPAVRSYDWDKKDFYDQRVAIVPNSLARCERLAHCMHTHPCLVGAELCVLFVCACVQKLAHTRI